jgi:hypothetical protein
MKFILTVVFALSFIPAAGAQEAAPTPCPEGEVCSVPEATPPGAVEVETPIPAPEVIVGPVQNLQEAPVVDLPPAPAPSAPDVPIPPNPYRRHYGIQLDLGVPDAVALGFVYRPIKYLRAEVAGTYNTLSVGARAGVTVLPIFGRVLSGTVEGGIYSAGNANKYAPHEEPALDSVSYEYANFHLGADFGRERVTFFIHGGMSYLSTGIHNLNQQFNNQVLFRTDPTLTAWFPSVKLGLIVYLF